MGRMYSASFRNNASASNLDFLEVAAPSDACVRIHGVVLGQSSDHGDAEAQTVIVELRTGDSSGSGGSSLTARPHEDGTPAFGGTVESLNTVKASGGLIIQALPFNLQAGFYYEPKSEKEMIVISPSERFVCALFTGPGDSVTWMGTVTFEELGG